MILMITTKRGDRCHMSVDELKFSREDGGEGTPKITLGAKSSSSICKQFYVVAIKNIKWMRTIEPDRSREIKIELKLKDTAKVRTIDTMDIYAVEFDKAQVGKKLVFTLWNGCIDEVRIKDIEYIKTIPKEKE